MGFGPSASGKTYCAKTIIKMLCKNDKDFPKSFLSIDGGIYREKSYIYQKLISLIKTRKFKGLKNLVLSSLNLKISLKGVEKRHTLFDSGIVKKKVIEYLRSQSKPTSLYVPETLGGCLLDCSNVYKKYIEIADDSKSWIGLLIWQHKTHNECNFMEGYTCKGCTESGTEREKSEGKIYSSSAWQNSMNNGRYHMKIAPGGRYEIHNGGSRESKSTIIDYSIYKILNNIPNGFVLQNNLEYLKIPKKTMFNKMSGMTASMTGSMSSTMAGTMSGLKGTTGMVSSTGLKGMTGTMSGLKGTTGMVSLTGLKGMAGMFKSSKKQN